MAKQSKSKDAEASEPQNAEAATEPEQANQAGEKFQAEQAERRAQLMERRAEVTAGATPSNQVSAEALTEIADEINEPVRVRTLSDLVAASAGHVPSTGDIAAMENANQPQ